MATRRCEECGKVQHESMAKAKDIARRTRANNLNDKRVFNAFRCEEAECRAFIVGTNDQFSTKGSRKLGRKPDDRSPNKGGVEAED
jgi:hypothetical protein